MDDLESYVRALKIEGGLGPTQAVHTGLAQKGLRLAKAVDFFHAGRPTCADATPAVSATSAQIDRDPPVTPAPAPSHWKCGDTEEAKRVSESDSRRGGKRKSAEAVKTVQPNAVEPKRALTVTQAVELYSISRSSLYNLIKEGTLPDVVVAGRRLFPRDSLESLISGKRQ